MRCLLFLVLFCCTAPLLAQTPAYVVGKILDDSTGLGVDNADVFNPRTRQRGRSNRLGAYYLTVRPGDSILVSSFTHGRAGLRWDGVTREPILRLKRQIADQSDAILLDEVTISGKREEQIKKELQQLLSEPRASKKLTGDEILGLAQSPITLLYELFSRQAKSRRRAAVLAQDFRRQRLADYRLDLIISQATRLRGDDLDRFKKYLNFSDDFVLTSSEYDLTFAVLERAKKFR